MIIIIPKPPPPPHPQHNLMFATAEFNPFLTTEAHNTSRPTREMYPIDRTHILLVEFAFKLSHAILQLMVKREDISAW